jgi:5-methylcytosine-specific restriction protein A
MNAFVHNRRGAMTPQRVARIFLASGGKCHVCGRLLRPGDDYEIDHKLALENGGTDDDDNLAPCCDWCHKGKTADDHALAGHGRRMATKHVVPKRFKKSTWRR